MSEVTYDALRKRITQLEAALHDVACHIWRADLIAAFPPLVLKD